MRGDIGRWRAVANAGFAVAVLALGGFGLYQVAGGNGECSRPFVFKHSSQSSAVSRSGIASAFRGSTPAWSSGSSTRRAGPAGGIGPAGR